MSSQSYFDFHFHPVFKQYITQFEKDYPSIRKVEELVKEMDMDNGLLDIVDEVVLHILQSQCSVDQMKKGGVRLGVANVIALEYGFADSQGFMSKILKSNLTKPMDQQYFNSIRRGELSYYQLFLKELDLFRKLNNANALTFLSRRLHKSIEAADDAYYVVLGMEGGHNLSRKKVGSTEPDQPTLNGSNDSLILDFASHPALDAATSLQHLQQALWDENMDLFYITLTHLSFISEQFLASHAFGMKMLKHDAFYPVGNGLTDEGRKVIDAAYGMKVQKDESGSQELTPVLIDIKHMSIKSRLDFYAYRKEKGYQYPILASHMGVSGYDFNEWKDALASSALMKKGEVQAVEIMTTRKKAGEWGAINKTFTFNPWSINLLDEDIIEILESDGLIGISLDVRILGFQAEIGMGSKDQSEFISTEDFKTFFPHARMRGLPTESLESVEVMESWLIPTKEERHPLCLCFNILHVVSVGKINTQKNPWEHLCIGSDFDGLIDPVKVCRDATRMSKLESDLVRWLPIAEKAYMRENGGPELLTRNTSGRLDNHLLAKDVRNIMYNNGKRLVERWLTSQLLKDAAEVRVPGIVVAAPNLNPQV